MAISSQKVDGDINKAFDALTDHDNELDTVNPSTNATSGTVAAGDKLVFADVSDSNTLKTVTAGDIAALGGSGEFADNLFRVTDNSDNTKKVALEVSGVTTGTTRTLTVPDASGTIALTSNIPAAGGYNDNGGYRTNYYYVGVGQAGGRSATASLGPNILIAVPFVVGADETFTRIGVEVTTLSSGKAARLGIYNWANGVPTTLVLDAGTIDTTTTGLKEVTISQALTRGVYGLAFVCNDATAAFRTPQSAGVTAAHYIGESTMGGTVAAACLTRSFTYAALPTPFGGTPTPNTEGNCPVMWLRKV